MGMANGRKTNNMLFLGTHEGFKGILLLTFD
jgi:hypothetical protein